MSGIITPSESNVKKNSTHINNYISTLICGVDFTFIIDNNRNIYSFGNTEYGKIGHSKPNNKDERVNILLTKISTLFDIKMVNCGEDFSICLTFEGEVFTFGRNNNGKLGIGVKTFTTEENDYTYIPQRVNLPYITQISSGDYFSMCLSDKGKVYCFGSRSYGELGLGETNSIDKPKEIPNLCNIDFIICGGYHTICKTQNGIFYSWGDNETGQLGHNNNESSANIPKICINWPTNIIDIKCGYTHSLLLTDNGQVYSFGNNNFGQLGINNVDIPFIPFPKLITSLPFIIRIECGYDHSMCIDDEYNLWVFGYNYFGQLGLADKDHRWKPIQLASQHKIIDISHGGFHTFFKTSENEIYAVGNNDSLQLGIETSEDKQLIPIQVFKDKKDIWASYHGKSRQKSARK